MAAHAYLLNVIPWNNAVKPHPKTRAMKPGWGLDVRQRDRAESRSYTLLLSRGN